MKRLSLALVAVGLAGCGSIAPSNDPQAHRPAARSTATPVSPASVNVPVDTTYRRRKCVHYYYVTDETGRRTRQPCPRSGPAPAVNPPASTPVPAGTPPDTTPPSPYHPVTGCGVERWAVKTLTDPGAGKVNLTPVDTTVGALTAFNPPIGPTDRVGPVEATTWRVHGTLTVAKGEKDSDYHLVVQDGGQTMIVEATAPACAVGSRVAAQIAQVRSALVAKVGQPQGYPSRGAAPNVPVTVEGVGFFDKLHGQTGVAPNGIELHPLTRVTFP